MFLKYLPAFEQHLAEFKRDYHLIFQKASNPFDSATINIASGVSLFLLHVLWQEKTEASTLP